MFKIIALLLINFANKAGYMGLFLYMLLVGTFIPLPSEIILIPSGYLSSIGEKNFFYLLFCASLGSLSGALINYFLSKYIASKFLKGKSILKKVETFFKKHGKISVFLAPLTPGMGQYISIPAGLSHMSLKEFIPLTFAANIIWVGFMLLIGYIFGKGENAHHDATLFSLILLGFVILSASIYVLKEVKIKA